MKKNNGNERNGKFFVHESCYIDNGVMAQIQWTVDLFGQPANYQEIHKTADKYNVWVL